MNVMKWLLESDPAIRWQVMRDLSEQPESIIGAERSRVTREGWGAQVLKDQSALGHWGPGKDENRMITVHTLALLKELGANPKAQVVRRAIARVRKYVTWKPLDNRPYFDGETEPCINGRILAAGAYFGHPSKKLLERLLGEQLQDGGWNCDAPRSLCSSFHSTICVLEGLLEYEKACGKSARLTRARARGQDYLLKRHLYRSLRTGEVIDKSWSRFQFPPSYRYDVLRGLDYFRNAGLKPDPRFAEAIEIVESRRHQNGLWPLNRIDPRRFTKDMEIVGGRSHWNTLRALRVLRWYGAHDHGGANDKKPNSRKRISRRA